MHDATWLPLQEKYGPEELADMQAKAEREHRLEIEEMEAVAEAEARVRVQEQVCGRSLLSITLYAGLLKP